MFKLKHHRHQRPFLMSAKLDNARASGPWLRRSSGWLMENLSAKKHPKKAMVSVSHDSFVSYVSGNLTISYWRWPFIVEFPISCEYHEMQMYDVSWFILIIILMILMSLMYLVCLKNLDVPSNLGIYLQMFQIWKAYGRECGVPDLNQWAKWCPSSMQMVQCTCVILGSHQVKHLGHHVSNNIP